MEALHRLAGRLGEVAALVAAVRPEQVDPGTAVWGPSSPGAPGDLAAGLQLQLTAALLARGQDATVVAGRLDDLAAEVRRAAYDYAEADESARGRAGGLA